MTDEAGTPSHTDDPTDPVKKASWTELYFDLVFVLAVAQVAHTVAADPIMKSVWTALGMFTVLWWTWTGFAVFYNRYGDANSLPQRIFMVAATVPCGLAAVAVHEFAHGSRTAFALSLAGARVMLALAHFVIGGALPRRIGMGYTVSALGFAASAFITWKYWWIIWVLVMMTESVQLFYGVDKRSTLSHDERVQARRQRRPFDLSWLIPSDKVYALDSHHLAERFGLFVIILLGEVVASAGQGMLAVQEHATPTAWLTLAGGIALAGVLWWLYFDAAAEINKRLLEMAGGSPAMARAIFAMGHMPPAFALILVAAGTQLLLSGATDAAPYFLVSTGAGIYLVGARGLGGMNGTLLVRIVKLGAIAVTFALSGLRHWVPAAGFVWIVAGWVAICALIAMSLGSSEQRIKEAVDEFSRSV